MEKKDMSYCKSFKTPDERREFVGHGHMDLLNFDGGAALGRAVFEPGWKWSSDVKPLAKTDTCEAAHLGYCVSGSMTIQMQDDTQFTIKAGDAFNIPPKHNAWVEGSEPCVLIDVTGYKEYAKKAA